MPNLVLNPENPSTRNKHNSHYSYHIRNDSPWARYSHDLYRDAVDIHLHTKYRLDRGFHWVRISMSMDFVRYLDSCY